MLKALLCSFFAALTLIGGLYVPQAAAKEMVFGSRISSWGWELMPALFMGPPVALGFYCILFSWRKDQPFVVRCMTNALFGVLVSSGLVVIALSLTR